METFTHSERVDVKKLDSESIQQISSQVAKVLTMAAAKGAESKGKFHIKIKFSKGGHTEVIIGDEGPQTPPGPGTPTPVGR